MIPILKDEEGFTLLETLISLLVSSFVIMLLTGGLLNVVSIRSTMVGNSQANNKTNQVTGDRQVEWHIFLNQLENYLQGSYDPVVANNQIHVKDPVPYSYDFQNIIYRLDASNKNFSRREYNGYHRMLTDIQTIHFTQEGGWLTADVLFVNDDAFSGRIWVESWIEKIPNEDEENEKLIENPTHGEEEEQSTEKILDDEAKDDKENEEDSQ